MMIPAKHGKRLIYSGGYRAAKQKVQKFLEENYKELGGCLSNHPEFYYTTVDYIVYDNWLTKSSKYQKLRKKDVANFTKNSEDVVFTFLGVDDSSIVDSRIRKALVKPGHTASMQCVVSLYEMDPKVLDV
jgi:Holliday junction resolvase RusA-like endonuclease